MIVLAVRPRLEPNGVEPSADRSPTSPAFRSMLSRTSQPQKAVRLFGETTWGSTMIGSGRFMLYSLHGQSRCACEDAGHGSMTSSASVQCSMTDILAAIGLVQLGRYGRLGRRRELIERYDSILRPLGIRSLEHCGDDFTSSGHLYLARIPGIGETGRNRIIARMAELGVACNVHYKPLPMFTAYKRIGFDVDDYPNAYRQYANEITLPLHTLLSDEDVEYVCKSLGQAVQIEMGS